MWVKINEKLGSKIGKIPNSFECWKNRFNMNFIFKPWFLRKKMALALIVKNIKNIVIFIRSLQNLQS